MQRYRRRRVWLALALAVALGATRAWAHPAQITYGPAQSTYGAAKVGSGPAHVTGITAGGAVLVIVPAAAAGDANCPSTLPAKVTSTTSLNTLNAAITCATPARTTSVQSISFYVDGTGTSGAHQTCSVYTLPGGYVAGTTSVPKVANGCDSVQWTAPNATTSGWITVATTGACPLAASTRYQIACNQDATYFLGYNNTACTTGGVQCNQERTSQTYTTAAVPASWVANNQGTATYLYYMTVQ